MLGALAFMDEIVERTSPGIGVVSMGEAPMDCERYPAMIALKRNIEIPNNEMNEVSFRNESLLTG